jgi:hypothetical protein
MKFLFSHARVFKDNLWSAMKTSHCRRPHILNVRVRVTGRRIAVTKLTISSTLRDTHIDLYVKSTSLEHLIELFLNFYVFIIIFLERDHLEEKKCATLKKYFPSSHLPSYYCLLLFLQWRFIYFSFQN